MYRYGFNVIHYLLHNYDLNLSDKLFGRLQQYLFRESSTQITLFFNLGISLIRSLGATSYAHALMGPVHGFQRQPRKI